MTSRTPSPDSGGVRADIQGLRGVAVLLVVLYHAGLPIVPGGYVGVDVFFVISGYLITGLLARELQATGRIDYVGFVARRARRLLPASLVMIATISLLGLAIYPALERAEVFGAARSAAVYLANFWFAAKAIDYLGGDAATNPFLHMWSLGVEEQFYLVWPLLLAAAVYLPLVGSLRWKVILTTGLITVVSLLACHWMTWRAQPWAFFGTPFRAWEFGLGALVFLLHENLRRLPHRLLVGLGMAGALGVALAGVWLDHDVRFPGLWALLPAGSAALLLASMTNRPHLVTRLLGAPPLVRIGDVSYSWYLWHWPLIVAVPVVSPNAGPGAIALAVGLSYLAAELSYRFVEQPIRHGRATRLPVRAAIGIALAATAGAATALTLLKNDAEQTAPNPQQRQFIAAREDRTLVAQRGCHARIGATEVVACESGAPDGERVVVLLGDSHAAHWHPALDAVAVEQGWRLVSFTKSACPWFDAPVEIEHLRRRFYECEKWRAEALRRIHSLAPDVVVVASIGRYKLAATELEEAMRRTIRGLQSSSRAVVLLRDTPWPGFNVPVCLARAEHRGADPDATCRLDARKAVAPGLATFEIERKVAQETGSTVVDLTDRLCGPVHCDVRTGEIVRYRDHSHLTATFARSLAPAITPALQAAVAR